MALSNVLLQGKALLPLTQQDTDGPQGCESERLRAVLGLPPTRVRGMSIGKLAYADGHSDMKRVRWVLG